MKVKDGSLDEEIGRTVPIRSGWTAQLIFSAFTVTLASFSFGYNISAVNAPADIFLQCKTSGSMACFPVNESFWGFIVAVMSIGAMVGSLTTGSLANRYGRRVCLIAVNIPYILGAVLMALALNEWMLLAGRFIIGLGVGASCIAVPMFLSEICSLETRGQITCAHQLMICIGLLAAEMVALAGLARGPYWRLMFAFAALPSLLQLAGMLWFVPESPRYLAQLGDQPGARKSLQFFRQAGYAETELEDMLLEGRKNEPAETGDSWGLLRLFQNWNIAGKSLTAAVLLHVAQQFSGINVVFYYSSILFATSDRSPDAPLSTVPAAISVLNLVMTILAIWLVERAGRRPLALVSSIGMVFAGAFFTIAYYFGLKTLSIIGILGYVSSYAVGMGPVPWLMMNEIFPTQALGAAVSMAVATNWMCNFAIGVSFKWIKGLLGAWLFTPYTLCTIAFTFYAWFSIPETKGRPIGFL